jgi:hypothetical protein
LTPAPSDEQLQGLTLQTTPAGAVEITSVKARAASALALVLLVTLLVLWIYFA